MKAPFIIPFIEGQANLLASEALMRIEKDREGGGIPSARPTKRHTLECQKAIALKIRLGPVALFVKFS
jgi:hypothetical protein